MFDTHKPLVSILLSTYNDARYLTQTINSVIQQSFTNWEFIMINDVSPDNTDEIIREYAKKDKRIVYIKNEQNLGLTENLNKGIDIAKGEFIARIDGDDVWIDPTKLQQQVDFMLHNPECGVVGCFAYAIDTVGNRLFEIKYPYEDREMREIMLKHCCLLHSAVLLKKSIVVAVNKYNTRYPFAQDYDLYLKMGAISKFHNIPTFMVHYRINPKGTTQTKYRKQMQEMVDIVKAHKSMYPHFYSGYLLWKVRKMYPAWFRGAVARDIKKKISLLHTVSGA